jgi:excisionase family DNA binding protein
MPRRKEHNPKPPVTPASDAYPKDFTNVREAAAYLSVSTSTIRELIQEGRLVPKRIGRYDIVRRSDLSGVWESAASGSAIPPIISRQPESKLWCVRASF